MTTILRKEKDGLFLYRGENWPIVLEREASGGYAEFSKRLRDTWFLSCERSGNRWRVKGEFSVTMYLKTETLFWQYTLGGFEKGLSEGMAMTEESFKIVDGFAEFQYPKVEPEQSQENDLQSQFFAKFGEQSFRGYPLEQCWSIWEFFKPHLK